MTLTSPIKEWWSADELADSGLPDVPTTKRGVNMIADRMGWRAHPDFARKRAGRGGGFEYFWKLLPSRAQTTLMVEVGPEAMSAPEAMSREDVWAYFDGLPQSTKNKAQSRLSTIQRVEELQHALGKYLAVQQIAKAIDASVRSIWNWFAMVEGVDPADRLAYLAPRNRAAAKAVTTATASPEFFDWLKADYLRFEGPEFTAAYANAVKLCDAKGLQYLHIKTARRWMDRTVPAVVQTYAREGARGLERRYPPQKRDRTGMVAMEGVNADFHKFDVFVQWPGMDKPMRPQMGAFQDLYSGKILSWCVDYAPNKVATMSAFAEMIDLWGIPTHCLFDNGMEFANKWLTGGAENRFRFKVREDDPLGILPQMGIDVHFATPGHGQAKPIERAFRDLASRVAKDPRFAGAYVGNRPDAKPENYMSKAIALDVFIEVLEQGIADHNARQGRTSDTTKGRSFDETFAESYGRAPIRKATQEQRRLWLMGQEVKTLQKNHGMIALFENEYWSDWMGQFSGKKIIARFDPENLHAGLYIYALDGSYMGFAECRKKAPFFDLASARIHAKDKARHAKDQRQLLKSIRPMTVEKVAAELDALPRSEPAPLDAKIVQLAQLAQLEERRRGGGLVRPSLPVPDTSRDAELTVLQVNFAAARPEAKAQDPEISRFWRMLDIERRMNAGDGIPPEDVEFWGRMKDHPVYLTQRDLYDRHGASAIG